LGWRRWYKCNCSILRLDKFKGKSVEIGGEVVGRSLYSCPALVLDGHYKHNIGNLQHQIDDVMSNIFPTAFFAEWSFKARGYLTRPGPANMRRDIYIYISLEYKSDIAIDDFQSLLFLF
jgi:hypothetical protein